MRQMSRSVVVTGASSGIGRATALAFAARGWSVAVLARRAEVLEEVAAQCRRAGGRGVPIAADVASAEDMQRAARTAVEAHGGIGVWVNNAGVGLFGPYLSGDVAAHRRVVETNLVGTMNGAAAALPYMIERGAGVIVNLSSIGGIAPVPFAASYAASKAGIRAFAASLREELADKPGIHVCTVFPAVVDTPALEHHGANVSGRALTASGPIIAPETVAETIVRLASAPRLETDIGVMTTAARIAYAASPNLTGWLAGLAFRRFLATAPAAPETDGNLFAPVAQGTAVSGTLRRRNSWPPTRVLVAAGIAAGAGGWLLAGRARRG